MYSLKIYWPYGWSSSILQDSSFNSSRLQIQRAYYISYNPFVQLQGRHQSCILLYNLFIIRFIRPLSHYKIIRMKTNNKNHQQSSFNSSGPVESPVEVGRKEGGDKLKVGGKEEEGEKEHTSYLKKLLGKYANQADYVESFTNSKQLQFQSQILNGRYQIKDRYWSAEQQKLKESRTNIHKNASQMLHAKKQLEDQLQMIEGEIKDNELNGSKQMTEQQRAIFLKKIQRDKRQLQKKKEEYAKMMQEKKAEQQRRAKELQQKEEAERKQKRQQQIAQRIKSQQQARKKKQQDFKNQALALKEKMKEKTTADKIEEHYNLIQNQTLQERKKRLAEIRMLHKPIDRKELQAHAEKLQQIHSERLAAMSAAALQKSKEKPAVIFYKSVFYKKVKQEQKTYLDKKNEEQVSKLREKRDKLKKFCEQIRQNYKPSIDEKKAEQIKFRSVNMKNRSLSSAKTQSANKLGLRYLEFSKMQINMKLLGSDEQEDEQDKPKKLDYLAELRERNKNRASQSAHQLLNKLEKVNISKEDRTKRILEFTDKIEKAAKRKEQLQKIGGNKVDDELDALYLEAIAAKLGLLQEY